MNILRRMRLIPLKEPIMMMKQSVLNAAILAAMLSSPAWAATVVTVNGEAIDSSQIDRQVKFVEAQSKGQVSDSPQLRDDLTNRLVTHTLMVQEARRLKIDEHPEYQRIVNQAQADARKSGQDKKAGFADEFATFKQDLLVQGLMYETVQKNPITEADTRRVYDDLNKTYQGSHEVQLSEIIVNQPEQAQQALADLAKGKSFKSVAQARSIDPAAKKTGGFNAAYVRLKDLERGAPPLYQAVKDLNKGQYTKEALRGNNIYAIFYVQDKRLVKVPSYAQLKNGLAADLQNQAINRMIAELYQKATIK